MLPQLLVASWPQEPTCWQQLLASQTFMQVILQYKTVGRTLTVMSVSCGRITA
jgi:hypothetical protein